MHKLKLFRIYTFIVCAIFVFVMPCCGPGSRKFSSAVVPEQEKNMLRSLEEAIRYQNYEELNVHRLSDSTLYNLEFSPHSDPRGLLIKNTGHVLDLNIGSWQKAFVAVDKEQARSMLRILHAALLQADRIETVNQHQEMMDIFLMIYAGGLRMRAGELCGVMELEESYLANLRDISKKKDFAAMSGIIMHNCIQ